MLIWLPKPRSTRLASEVPAPPTVDWLRTSLDPGCKVINCDQSRPFKGSSRTVVLSTTSLICDVTKSILAVVSRTSTSSEDVPTFSAKFAVMLAPTVTVRLPASPLENPCDVTRTAYTEG